MEIKITGDIKSMRFSAQVDEKLTRLSLKLGRTKKELFSQMVDYFYRTKKDPIDLNDEMLKKEITSGISKIVSFYKQQENDLLIPQFETVNSMESSMHNFLENSEHTSEKLNRLSLDQQAVIRSLSQLKSNIFDKKDLKFQFRNILESYITSRDTLGWNASSKSKEELRKSAYDSLFDL